MTQNHPNRLSARRVTLMASVAGIGLAVLLVGPGAFRTTNTTGWTGAAIAAENMLQPSGFADIVTKVKPAVISRRLPMYPQKTPILQHNARQIHPAPPSYHVLL